MTKKQLFHENAINRALIESKKEEMTGVSMQEI